MRLVYTVEVSSNSRKHRNISIITLSIGILKGKILNNLITGETLGPASASPLVEDIMLFLSAAVAPPDQAVFYDQPSNSGLPLTSVLHTATSVTPLNVTAMTFIHSLPLRWKKDSLVSGEWRESL